MKASSKPSAIAAAIMAFSTKAAGPSLQSFSKTDAIAGSGVTVGAILRALLIGIRKGRIHARRKLTTQPAAIRLRRKSPDLVRTCEVFRTGCEKNISGHAPCAPCDQ